MNHLISFRAAVVAGLIFTAPATGFTKDKHHHDHHSSSSSVYGRSYYCPGYGHGYHSSYHSRPSISFGFYSAPAYYYDTPSYSYDSYSAPYYRGLPRTTYRYSYRDSSRYSDDLALDVQRALARRGYYRGGIDGDVGPGTRSAIRSYQYNHRLEVTGRIDGRLLRSLGIS